MPNLIFRIFSPKRSLYRELVKLLGFIPQKWQYYELAFIHRSASITTSEGTFLNNEKLEFLGDAILDAIVAEYLFLNYPDKNEGFLSKMRSKIVKRNQLNLFAYELHIDQLLIHTTPHINGGKYICGNALEALIGAIYLDKGYKKTRKFIIEKILNKHINLTDLEKTETDYKSRIIEWAQKQHNTIIFECKEQQTSNDPTHPTFVAEVMIEGKVIGKGEGFSKKEAEQHAAEVAFDNLKNYIYR